MKSLINLNVFLWAMAFGALLMHDLDVPIETFIETLCFLIIGISAIITGYYIIKWKRTKFFANKR
jgi:hypothetical protein